jgi:RNA recognition motif-containing protein
MLSVDDIMRPPPPTATVYISGFSQDIKEADLLKHFSQIGVIKKHKETGAPQIYLYKDEAGVRWDFPPSGQA